MGAPDLLQHLRSEGFALALTPDGRLSVAPARALTDAHREAIRTFRDELAALLGTLAPAAPAERRSGNRLMTVEEADRCHTGGWDDAEIAAFTARHVRLLTLGFTDGDADDLAERLTLRDRDGDTRRLCIECAHYRGGRCRQAARSGVGPEVGALAVVFQRCTAFEFAGGT